MRYLYPIGAFTLLTVIIFSLFLPQYEALTDGMLDDTLSYMSQYPNPDQSGGFFGGGYYTTFNGFGSLNAILNALLSLSTAFLILYPRLTRKMLIIPMVLLIIFFAGTVIELLMAPYVLSEGDKLFSGFYVLRICEMGIFYLAFKKAKSNTQNTNSTID